MSLNTNIEITTNYIVKWKKQNIACYVLYATLYGKQG